VMVFPPVSGCCLLHLSDLASSSSA
jgi:hypothetical protein